jgi:microcystin-dependent protein
VNRTTYAALFTAISTVYGAGDGVTTFNLPDLRGRVVAGQDDMGGSSANRLTNQSGGLNGDTLGATGGAETHTLTEAEIAVHDHLLAADVTTTANLDPTDHLANVANFAGDNAYILVGTTTDPTLGLSGEAGSGDAHNNVQPTIILNYIIKT